MMAATAENKKRNRLRLLIAGSVLTLGIVALYIYTSGGQEPAAPPSRQEIAQNECAQRAFNDYIKADNSLLQQQGAAPLASVEMTIAQRRLQEQYCLQFARCQNPDPTNQLFALVYAATFDSCLRDEALEKYDAVPRSGD